MRNTRRRKPLILVVLLLALGTAVTCGPVKRYYRVHPVRLKEPPTCSECHPSGWHVAFDHTEDFAVNHALPLQDLEGVCVAACHRTEYCDACHDEKRPPSP